MTSPPRANGSGTPDPLSKICASCGRRFEWRKKWARDWDRVVYCSGRCRSRKVSAEDTALEQAFVNLLASRESGASVCPSEVARLVAGDDWRRLMEPARRAARQLVAAGRVVITQRGKRIDPSAARGPIRVQLDDGRG